MVLKYRNNILCVLVEIIKWLNTDSKYVYISCMKSGLVFQNAVNICSQFQYQPSYTHTESLLTHIHMATYKHTPMYIMHPYIDTHASNARGS